MSNDQAPAITPVRHAAGDFIWTEGEAKPFHYYLYARRSFDLEGPPRTARLRITAADRYLLYVNGAYVDRGPARSDPRRKSYDTHDVTDLLTSGRNVVAVRAYHYGTPAQWEGGWGSLSGNGYTVGERAGLWAEIEVTDAQGVTQTIGTDEAWRLAPAKAWRRDVEHIVYLVGNTEVYDANADPTDWMAVDFDDSAWTPAWVIPLEQVQWFLLEEREIPSIREEEALAARLVTVGEVIDLGRPGQTDIPELLNDEPHFPLEHARAENAAAVLAGDGSVAELQGRFAHEHGIRTPYLILDFGRQVFGFPRVRLRSKQGAILDMTYGQQLINGRIPAALRYGDRYIARDGEQTWEIADYKQFRYLHLTVRSTYDPVQIESISVNTYRYPTAQRGRFQCSDPVLTQVWQACVDTNDLHMEDSIVCDAYRERAPWGTGDGSHGVHVVYAAWGDIPLSDRFLRLVPLSDRGDGKLSMVYPPDVPPTHCNMVFMPQWSTRVREHYLFTGRRWVLEELYPSVQRQLDWFAPYRDSSGLLRDVPHGILIDWAPNDFRGASLIMNCVYLKGLEDAAWLALQVGQASDAERWQAIHAEVRTALREGCWEAERGLYNDAVYQGGRTGVVSDLGNAYAILYGVATDDQVAGIAEHLAEPHPDLVSCSPLFYGYVADALLVGGAHGAVRRINARYAQMMEATDNPTMWEGWQPFTAGRSLKTDDDYLHRDQRGSVQPAGVRSLVHSGADLTGYVLSTRVLGVLPTLPGFERCEIRPRTRGLDSAGGVFPAPQGDIEIDWRKNNGTLELKLRIPAGVTADTVLDRDAGRAATLSVDGDPVGLDDADGLARKRARADADSVRIELDAGVHVLELTQI